MLRYLIRRPSFAGIAVLTMALGIGAPTSIFTVIHAVLLKPLPYPEPDRLVSARIDAKTPQGPLVFDAMPASAALDWRAHSSTLSDAAVYDDRAMTLTTANGPFRLTGIAATPNLFSVLAVSPAAGRLFDPTTAGDEIVLSDDAWRRYFGGDPTTIGTTITLDGRPRILAGVMPHDFRFPTAEASFWVPLTLDPNATRGMLIPAIGRLKPGASLQGAIAEGRQILRATGDTDLADQFGLRTMQDQMVGGVRRLLWMLMVAVSVVFAIATTNIALLLLTRGAGREREFSIRLALGAGRARLSRQLLTEGFLLAAIGGVVGVGFAALSLQALLRLAPADLPRLREATLNGVVLAFAVMLTMVTGAVFGLLSAGRAVVTDPVRALGRLGGDSHTSIAPRLRRRLNLLAAGELALTMVLLVGAGLLLRSFVRVLLVDQGFDGRGALAAQINLPSARYPTPPSRLAMLDRVLEQLRRTPGLADAAVTMALPNRQPTARFLFSATGVPVFHDPLSTPSTEVRSVSEGFFAAMGIPILAGREFQSSDTAGAEPVIVISARMAKREYADRNPVGQLLYSGEGTRRVIGVVGDVKPATAGLEIAPATYLPIRQDLGVFEWFGTATLIVRSQNLAAAATSVRTVALSLDRDMPPFNVRPLTEDVAALVAGPKFAATVLAIFASIALVLATVGVYGVMAFSAAQRTREIGIRMALGATGPQVLRAVMRDGVGVIGIGITSGTAAAIWLARAMTGLLHEVTPADPGSIASVSAVLLIAGLIAVYLPARRATRVNTLSALRE